jgi:hypothetical protein
MRKNAHRKDRDKTVLGIISNKRNNFQSIYIGQANFEQNYVRGCSSILLIAPVPV